MFLGAEGERFRMKYKQKGILAENNWKPIGSFLRRPPMILIIVLELLALLFLG